MKTRYKILITVCLSFIPFSFFVPDVFLIFHLDKYETSEKCDTVNGTWNWYYDTCDLGYEKKHDKQQCEDIGAHTKCKPCTGELEYDPWPRMLPWECIPRCAIVCEFIELDEMGLCKKGDVYEDGVCLVNED